MRLFHWHGWRAVDAAVYRVTQRLTGCGHDETYVLWRCDGCGETKVTKLDGQWTIDKIRGGK